VDLEHAWSQFNLVATVFFPAFDTDGYATATSNAIGYHLGALYQFSEETRIGIGYQSKVIHHMSGNSKFIGPLANDLAGGEQYSGDYSTNVNLPATTTLSLFHTLNTQVDIMGSITYTQWSIFKEVVMQNVAGIEDGESSNNITVVTPENYRNTWNYSVGGNLHINPQVFLRAGVGYDQSPTNNVDRDVQLPDADRVAVALGGHYQATKSLGFDLGWTHFFQVNPSINNVEVVGDQVTTTSGSVNANADVYGLQMKWDIT
jgi:long-chain fatty acid transport protein